jgi:uncharacterized protein (AIM24 family)
MDAKVVGTVMPVLEVALDPGEVVFSESGELSWMTASVQMRTSTQAGGGGGIGGVFKRAVTGGSIFMSEYTAAGQPGMVAFAAKLPGSIFPVDVAPQPGMSFMAHRHGFLCGTQGVNLGIGFQQSLGAGVFGGDGFILQRINGQGRAWIELSGEIITFDLAAGEVMRASRTRSSAATDSSSLSWPARAASGCSRCRSRSWRMPSTSSAAAAALPRRAGWPAVPWAG